MPAIDTILGDVHNATAGAIGLTAVTTATGDTLTVKSFPQSASAKLEAIFVQASGARMARVTSSRLHDNVTGITLTFGEEPAAYTLPQEVGEPLVAGDVLSFLLSAAATSDSVGALSVYYSQLDGGDAKLRMYGDVMGNIKHIKSVEVDVTTSATIGAWQDTLINTTEDQLHAQSQYAVLGYLTDTALAVVGVKGQETANLRVCGPGQTATIDTSDYFVRESNAHGTPHIPIISANNKGSIYVSTAANTASVAAKITLILAELATPIG